MFSAAPPDSFRHRKGGWAIKHCAKHWAVSGNAADEGVLTQAHVTGARLVVLAIPDAYQARSAIEIARALQPNLQVVARAHSDDEAALLRKERDSHVFIGEHELALGMTRHVLEQLEKTAI